MAKVVALFLAAASVSRIIDDDRVASEECADLYEAIIGCAGAAPEDDDFVLGYSYYYDDTNAQFCADIDTFCDVSRETFGRCGDEYVAYLECYASVICERTIACPVEAFTDGDEEKRRRVSGSAVLVVFAVVSLSAVAFGLTSYALLRRQRKLICQRDPHIAIAPFEDTTFTTTARDHHHHEMLT